MSTNMLLTIAERRFNYLKLRPSFQGHGRKPHGGIASCSHEDRLVANVAGIKMFNVLVASQISSTEFYASLHLVHYGLHLLAC